MVNSTGLVKAALINYSDSLSPFSLPMISSIWLENNRSRFLSNLDLFVAIQLHFWEVLSLLWKGRKCVVKHSIQSKFKVWLDWKSFTVFLLQAPIFDCNIKVSSIALFKFVNICQKPSSSEYTLLSTPLISWLSFVCYFSAAQREFGLMHSWWFVCWFVG